MHKLLIVFCLFACSPAFSQSSRTEKDARGDQQSTEEVAQLFSQVTKNDFDRVRCLSLIPALKEAFFEESNENIKEHLANVLVRLGEKDDVYWSVLSKRSQEIVNDTTPYPFAFDENGNARRDYLSPEFLDWARRNNASALDVFKQQTGTFPAVLINMASAGDPRGLPILLRGLASQNLSVEWIAAKGLATLHDKASVPAIIEAAGKAPLEARKMIAESLFFFDDPIATAAGERLIPDKEFVAEALKTAKERGTRGLW